MTNPKLLLLDEPAEGLSPLAVGNLIQGLLKLKQQGLTAILAEQNVNFARKVSERAYVIEKGEVRYEGSIEALISNNELKRKYLTV
jgi:branched-chain amino acid transport system ATP-binding protein